ncbi:MAG: hypothetical protein NXI31_01915 [bacterium]|nr:hypothetical protein [bacterium]
MNTPSALLAAASLLAITPEIAVAQAPEPAAGTWLEQRRLGITNAWYRFAKAHSRPDRTDHWRVEWNRAAGTPAAIFGPGLPRHSALVEDRATATAIARQLLNDHAALLGQGASTFELDTYARVRQMHILVFEQRFRGIPVIQGRADVRLHDSGVVALFGSVCFAIDPSYPVQPTVPAATAVATAKVRVVPRPRRPTAPARLTLWADRTADEPCVPRLAWEVDLQNTIAAGLAYVDAHTGGFIQFERTRCSLLASTSETVTRQPHRTTAATSPATARPGTGKLPVTGTVRSYVADGFGPGTAAVNRPLAGVRVTVRGGGSALTDLSGWFSIPHAGSAPVTVDVSFNAAEHVGTMTAVRGMPMSTTATITPGTPGSIQVYDANASEFEIAQSTAFYYTDRVARFARQAHILGNHPNLMALQSLVVRVNDNLTLCNAYYVPGQPPGVRFAAASVAAGCPNFAFPTVIEHEWGHGLDDAFGGFAFDKLSEGWADIVANYSTGQPIIGEDFYGPGQHVRDARNNEQYPNGVGHAGGLPWMGGAWKLRERLIARHGAVAGRQLAESLVIGSIAADARSIPAAVREIYLLDDNDANLNNGTPNCAELLASFTSDHSIPSPLTTCSTNPGVTTPFGNGCVGTATSPPVCQSQNDQNTGNGLASPVQGPLRVAYTAIMNQAMVIDRVDLFTRSGTGGGRLSIHRDAGGIPAATATATGQLAVPMTTGWVSTTLTPPLPVATGERIHLVHIAADFDSALLTIGAPSASPTLLEFGIGTWLPLFSAPDHAVWRLGCPVAGPFVAPELTTADLPEIGRGFTLDVSQAAPNTNGLLILGTSNTASYARPLPWDLTQVGAPGCSLLVSANTTEPLVSDSLGHAAVTFAIPASSAIVGLVVYGQTAMWDAGANPLGVAMSGALRIRIGTP